MIWIFSSMPPDFALDLSPSSLVTVFLSSDIAWGRIRSFLCRVKLSKDSSSNMSERKWQNTQKTALSIPLFTYVVVSRSTQNKCCIPSHLLTCLFIQIWNIIWLEPMFVSFNDSMMYCVKLTFFACPWISTEHSQVLHVLQNNGVLATVCGKVIVCSMSEEYFEGSVDMGDPACPFDSRRCASTPSSWPSWWLSTVVVCFPHEMQKIVHLAHHWFFLLESQDCQL